MVVSCVTPGRAGVDFNSKIFYVFLDTTIGIVPIIGGNTQRPCAKKTRHLRISRTDILDVLFKANLRNLTLLEVKHPIPSLSHNNQKLVMNQDWLLKSSEARIYNISIPPSDVFLPRKRGGRTARTDPKDKCTYLLPPWVLVYLPVFLNAIDRNIRKTTRMKPADLD